MAAAGPAGAAAGAAGDRAVGAGRRGRGSTERGGLAAWTDCRRAGRGGCGGGGAGVGGGGRTRRTTRKPRPGWGASGRAPSHACCQRGSPGKTRSWRGAEAGACTPRGEAAAALAGGGAGC